MSDVKDVTTERRTPRSSELDERLQTYYTHYYRDVLGIPGWRGLVAFRLDDQAYERQRLARLEDMLNHSVRGCRLLNLGCGTGGFNVAATRAGATAWGIDLDAEAVAIAGMRVRRGSIVQGAAEALPFFDQCFDVVYCYSTLEHVADAAQAVREMARVLRPGGALYVHTPNRWACFEGHYKVFVVPGAPRWLARAYLALRGRPTTFLGTVRPMSLGQCRRILEEARLRITRVPDEARPRPVGGPLWPLVQLYYWAFGIEPYLELLAVRPLPR